MLATSIIARRERVTQPNDPRIVERTDTPLHEQEKEKEEKKEEKIDGFYFSLLYFCKGIKPYFPFFLISLFQISLKKSFLTTLLTEFMALLTTFSLTMLNQRPMFSPRFAMTVRHEPPYFFLPPFSPLHTLSGDAFIY